MADDDSNALGVMVFTDLDGSGPVLYYVPAEDLKKYKMSDGSPGQAEGAALVSRGVVLSAVDTTDVPVGSFSTLVNVAALRTPAKTT